eukprot:COSAG01_NODE_1169_length_11408_cov_35.108056_7_plen_76_part_00
MTLVGHSDLSHSDNLTGGGGWARSRARTIVWVDGLQNSRSVHSSGADPALLQPQAHDTARLKHAALQRLHARPRW